ncbi:MAG: hypothetical protein HY760_06650 [Nitrospirae bacterium]|nr:hypothetical protein [Nitrospirota bacterium]
MASISRSTEKGVDGTYLLPGLPRDPFVLHAGKAGYDPQEVWVAGGDYDPTVSILVHSMVLRESPDAILLRHPAPGEILGGSGMVVGEFRPDLLDTAREIAVRVNGLPAFVVGNRFMINGLHRVSGPGELTVEVLSPDGMAASETFPVEVILNEEPFFLLPSAESGIVPFRISVRGSPEVPWTLQVEGPAAPEVTAETGGYAVTFSSPGIYLLEGERVIDGGTARDRIAVAVSDRGEVAPRLQDRWSAMIGALAGGDLDGALENLTAEAAYRYRGLLGGMGEAGARFFSDLPGIVLVGMEGGVARARLSKDDMSYPVWFARDLDGFYRIHRF